MDVITFYESSRSRLILLNMESITAPVFSNVLHPLADRLMSYTYLRP